MKNIFTILFSFFFLMLNAQNTQENKNLLKINIAASNLINLYEQECKVTTKNSENFYELFCDELVDENDNFIWEPKHINDINPSSTFNKKIGVVDYKDQMKSISRFIVDLEILEIGEVDYINSDSGFINLIVRKTVSSSKYNEPSYNIINSGITERVDYSSDNLLKFKLKFYKDFKDFYCKIYEVSAFKNSLEREYIYTYSYNTIFKKEPVFLDFCGFKPNVNDYEEKDSIKFNKDYIEWIECKQKYKAFGNKILYTKSNRTNDLLKLPGYKTPKAKIENSFVNLVYREKNPVLISAQYPASINVDFGSSLIPTSYSYEENISPAISLFLPINKKFYIGLKINNTVGKLSMNLDSYQTSYIETDNSGMDYTRINTVSNMIENIDINENNIFISAKYLLNPRLSIIGNYLISNTSSVTSNRSANVLYQGQYGEDLFNILISENIEGEDFGSSTVSKTDDINFNISNYAELGGEYTQKINETVVLFASVVYQLYTQNLIEKSNTQISTTASEFNSILTNTEFFKITKLNFNIGVSIKLL